MPDNSWCITVDYLHNRQAHNCCATTTVNISNRDLSLSSGLIFKDIHILVKSCIHIILRLS